jgi:hypothetical protein
VRHIAHVTLGLGLLCTGCRTSPESRAGGQSAPTAGASSAIGPEQKGSTLPAQTPLAPAPQIVNSTTPEVVVKRCPPCEFQPTPGLRYAIAFAPDADGNVKQLEAKSLTPNNATAQTFDIDYAWSHSGDFVLQGIDLNFDGTLDLAFGPVTDTPNETLYYWWVDTKRNALELLGSFPDLKVDAKAREIRTYEKGGHAGLLFEAKTYRWEGGKLVVTETVTQHQEPGRSDYRETTRKYEAGRVVDEKTRRVKAP